MDIDATKPVFGVSDKVRLVAHLLRLARKLKFACFTSTRLGVSRIQRVNDFQRLYDYSNVQSNELSSYHTAKKV